jgi:UDP-N-acetylmuramoyl-tripeptide--D-alanyl-D-alanine ligase
VFTLADVIEALTGAHITGTSLFISEASVDSRQIIPAAMFVALPGERVDGHQFIGEVFQLGASLALVEKEVPAQFPVIDLRAGVLPVDFHVPDQPFCIRVENTLQSLQKIAAFWRRKVDVRVIGITGSIGKSTTKELIGDVLSQKFRTLKSKGNLNNEIGLPVTLLSMGLGQQVAVLEMGFYLPGEITLLCELALPQVGVITNVGPVHAERAGSLEAIAKGKSELVQALPPSPLGVAILNFDDPLVRNMAGATQAKIFFYGLDPHADLWADQIESIGLEGIRCRLHYQGETFSIRVPLIGQHSVHTVLRAVAVGLVEGMSWPEIISGLKQGRSQLRLVAVQTQSGALLLDDSYNASPESTLAALNLLAEMDGRKIAVLGEMRELGIFERPGHEKVGIRVAEVCHDFVAVGEKTRIMIDASIKAGLSPERIHWFETVPEVSNFLLTFLKKGDIALVKGSLSMGMAGIVSALEKAE